VHRLVYMTMLKAGVFFYIAPCITTVYYTLYVTQRRLLVLLSLFLQRRLRVGSPEWEPLD